MMPLHAVALVDHQSANVLQSASDQVVELKVYEHLKLTRQNDSGVRSEHAFFGQGCDTLDGICEVLVVGGHLCLADFRHDVEKHRPPAAMFIVGWEAVKHPSDNQLVALARKHFVSSTLEAAK